MFFFSPFFSFSFFFWLPRGRPAAGARCEPGARSGGALLAAVACRKVNFSQKSNAKIGGESGGGGSAAGVTASGFRALNSTCRGNPRGHRAGEALQPGARDFTSAESRRQRTARSRGGPRTPGPRTPGPRPRGAAPGARTELRARPEGPRRREPLLRRENGPEPPLPAPARPSRPSLPSLPSLLSLPSLPFFPSHRLLPAGLTTRLNL